MGDEPTHLNTSPSITMNTRNAINKEYYPGAKVKKMNNDVYAQRRRVMDVLYTIKRKGITLPRVEVRIVDDSTTHGVLGYAIMDAKVPIIHIVEKSFKLNDDQFTFLVLHECVHTIFKVQHDDNCYLMGPYLKTNVDVDKMWETFIKYVEKYK